LADLPPLAVDKIGRPVVVVVIIDPFDSKASTGLLHMQMKVQGRTQAAEPHVQTDLRAMIMPSTTVARQVILHAIKETVCREWFHKKYSIEGHVRPVTQTWAESFPDPPDMEVATVTSEGYFAVPTTVVKPFLEAEITCMEVHTYIGTLNATVQQPNMKWSRHERGAMTAPPSLQVAEAAPSNTPAAGGITTLEELTRAGTLADVPSSNAKYHVLVTRDHKFYVHVLADVTVTQGDRLFQMGSGGRKDEAEATQATSQGKLSIPIKLESDASQVYFQKNGAATEQLFTFYGLHSQLTLDGHRNIGLNYHIFEPAAGGSRSVERFAMRVVRAKFWVTKRSRAAPDDSTPDAAVTYDLSNIGCLMSLDQVPNRYVKALQTLHSTACVCFGCAQESARCYISFLLRQVIWHLIQESRDGGFWLQFERPSLSWASTMQLREGQLFRIA
jgi:hypothetical protein